VPLFGTLADQSAAVTGTGLPVDTGHAAAAVGMHVGYPATMNINDISAMMMMSDGYHGNPPAMDQAAMKHMLHSVTDVVFCFRCCDSDKELLAVMFMCSCRSFVNSVWT